MSGSGSDACSTIVTTKATAQHNASSGSQLGLPKTGFCSSVTKATTTMEVKMTSTCRTIRRDEVGEMGQDACQPHFCV